MGNQEEDSDILALLLNEHLRETASEMLTSLLQPFRPKTIWRIEQGRHLGRDVVSRARKESVQRRGGCRDRRLVIARETVQTSKCFRVSLEPGFSRSGKRVTKMERKLE